ncbi:MAG: extracellular solute-binding protein [Thermoplasmata archaeon]|nr:extracellular solute-binding protein [Thermoplasmata archaeon]
MKSATSPASPLLVIIVAAAFLLVGVAVGYELRGPAPSSPQAQASQTLSVTAAGTLGTVFPQVADALANNSPGVQVPSASQQYEGSILALNAIAQLHQSYDVAAAADYHLIPSLLESSNAGWEVGFASTPEALAYDPTASALSGINATNWPQKIGQPGVRMGVANASTDPNGYNEIFSLQLEGLEQNGSLASVYGHFFTTPVGSYAVTNPATAKIEPETQAALLLSTHVVQVFIIYQSYAVSHHLSYVPLDHSVSLGSTAPADVTNYAKASTEILTASGATQLVRGAPVIFSATVPTNAPNPQLGTEFVDLLISAEGGQLLQAAGFTPLVPAWLQSIGTVPPEIIGATQPFPASLPVTGG